MKEYPLRTLHPSPAREDLCSPVQQPEAACADQPQNAAADQQYLRMTRTPVPQLILRLCIPTTISMLVTNLYNMVDTAFVGTLGNSASGAVGIVFGFMSILQAVGFLFGQGSGSIVSRKLGGRDAEGASVVASTGFFLALGSGTVIAILSLLWLRPLVMLLGSTETIFPYAVAYIRFILLAAPLMVPSLLLNNLLRYEGKAALGMVGLLTGAVLNIFGDALFIFGFQMGVAGAGLATALSQIISFFILLSMFLRGRTQSRLSIRLFSWNWRRIADIGETGLPSLLRQGLSSVSTVLLNSLAGNYGDVAVAAMSIVSRIIMFVFSAIVGIGQGFQPVSAFNYGAGNYRRVRQGYRFTLLLSQAVLTVLTVFLLLFSGSCIQLFRDDLEVIAIGTRALRLQGVALLFLPLSMVTEMLLQSTGQKLPASLLSALRSGLFFIPALLLLNHFRGLSGIQEAQPLAFVLSCFTAVFFALSFFRTLPKEDQL
ncbi:MAG: MATE family efflux transporter [Candidatus Onthomonas sp.]